MHAHGRVAAGGRGQKARLGCKRISDGVKRGGSGRWTLRPARADVEGFPPRTTPAGRAAFLETRQGDRYSSFMRRRLKLFISFALLVALGVLVARRDGIGSLFAALRRVDGRWLWTGVLLQLVAVALGITRWSILLRSQGAPRPWRWLARTFLIGRFVGVFTPSTIGLDGYRIVATRDDEGIGRGARAIAVEKALGFIALSALSFLLLPFGAVRFYGAAGLLGAAALGLVAAVGLLVMRAPRVGAQLARRCPAPVQRRLLALMQHTTAAPLGLATFVAAFGLGVASHAATAGTFVATGLALGVSASPVELLVVGHAIVLTTLLPLSFAGVGVREGTAVALLGLVSVGAADAALVGTLGFVVAQPAALWGGLLQLKAAHLDGAEARPTVEPEREPHALADLPDRARAAFITASDAHFIAAPGDA